LSLVFKMPSTARLRRDLTLWDLIFYGIVLVQPVAPMPLFGITQVDSRGHAALTLLIGMAAMLLTAVSYGRMAALYPSAGSAYVYVGRGLNPHLGFLAGWGMLLCYLMFPVINVVYVAVTLHRLFPPIPFTLAAVLCAATFTFLNLRGIRSTRRANQILLTVMCAVIGSFMVLAVRHLLQAQGWGGIFSAAPFYDRRTFDLQSLRTATAFSVLTYLGFDGVTTLAEDVHNPRRNVPLATVLTVLLTGLFSCLQVYLGQRVWPDYHGFPNVETAFMDVCQRVGGAALYNAMAAILIVACFGTALAGQVSSARILFSMGRENVLPRKVFAYLDPRRNTPSWNYYLVGLLGLGGAVLFSFEQGADVLNFGSFLAFMGVNIAAFWQFYVAGRGQDGHATHLLADAIPPLLGFLCCLAIWWGLPAMTKLIGGSWLLLGIVIAAVATHGFRTPPPLLAPDEA
jgi:amino acid transporter